MFYVFATSRMNHIILFIFIGVGISNQIIGVFTGHTHHAQV